MRRERDRVAAHNERMQLAGTTFNAIALGVFGFGLIQPVIAGTFAWTWRVAVFVGVGLCLHALAHYIVSQVDREVPDDRL